jgi:hypothetical protein
MSSSYPASWKLSIIMPVAKITSFIVSCRYRLYADDVQLTSAAVLQITLIVAVDLNLDLDHILQWSLRNSLLINVTKSQAMVVNSRFLQLDDACQVSFDGNTIDFHQKVKNLGLIMNGKLTWDDQISKICQKSGQCHNSHQHKLIRSWSHR